MSVDFSAAPAELREWLAKTDLPTVIASISIGRAALEHARGETAPAPLPPPPAQMPAPSLPGPAGEAIVEAALKSAFGSVVNTTRAAKNGDLCLYHSGEKIMIEVKNYKNTVPSTEIEKFGRDLDVSGASGGVFISLAAPIAGQPKLSTRYFTTTRGVAPGVLIVAADPEMIIGAVSICARMIAVLSAAREISADSESLMGTTTRAVTALAAARCEIATAATEVTKRLINSTAAVSRCETELAAARAEIRARGFHSVTPDPFADSDAFARYSLPVRAIIRTIAHTLGGDSLWKVSARKAACAHGCINFTSTPTFSVRRDDALTTAAISALGADFAMTADDFVLACNEKCAEWLAREYLHAGK
jgi:hypothetical protein